LPGWPGAAAAPASANDASRTGIAPACTVEPPSLTAESSASEVLKARVPETRALEAGIGTSPPARMSSREWVVVLLLVFSVVINYVDRSDLSLAAPVMQKQFALSPVQLGSLLAAFFWTYALLQITGVVGWLSDRFAAGWVLLCGYVLWSAATIATGFTAGFASLFAFRLLLGAGESVAYPCYSRIFAAMPQQYRGRANSLIDAGTKLGPAAGAFVGGMLLVHLGWRMLFFVLGFAGLLWVVPWWRMMPRSTTVRRPVSEPVSKPAAVQAGAVTAASLTRILRLRPAWGTFLGHFCSNYFFYFLLAWLPEFAVREMRLSIRDMSRLTAAIFLLIAASTLTAGWISDWLITRGLSPSIVRRAVVAGGLLVASSLMGFALIGSSKHAGLALLLVASVGYGAAASSHWAITQTLAGAEAAGRWSSFQNGVANLSGIVAPWVAGWIVEVNGSARLAFAVSGAVALAGAACWWLLVPRVEPVSWQDSSEPRKV
jgi:MFS transporter, ACS family, D-galactonate transporter